MLLNMYYKEVYEWNDRFYHLGVEALSLVYYFLNTDPVIPAINNRSKVHK